MLSRRQLPGFVMRGVAPLKARALTRGDLQHYS
jgi:hypothetical protein